MLKQSLWLPEGTLQTSTPTTQVEIANWPIHYFITQYAYSLALTCSYVLPITKEFNISIGLGPSFNFLK